MDKKETGRGYVATLIGTIAFATSAMGHHSAVIFDTTTAVAFTGTVTDYDWTNPHVYLYVERHVDSAESVIWQLEADATSIMSRSGWGPETFSVGDRVVVRANPDRIPARNQGLLVSIVTEDGVVLTPRAGGRAASVGSDSLSGTWDGLRGFTTRRFIYGELTEKGRAVQASYNESDNPTSDCIPFPLPAIIAAPYLMQIEIQPDIVFIRSEIFNTERSIYMDGRGHPENGIRSNQGHSIGWWEDEVLIVDTALFSDNPAGNRDGIASGAQKHVVERYELIDEGRQVAVEFIVEDTEYLVDPMVGGIVWDFAPDREFTPFNCDPEVATRYYSE